MSDEENNAPLLFGLWQLLPKQLNEPEIVQTESVFIKYMIQIFDWISLPILYLFYFKGEKPTNLSNFLHKIYIAILISIIPFILFVLYKYQNIHLKRQTITIGIWMAMLAVVVVIYASQNVTK